MSGDLILGNQSRGLGTYNLFGGNLSVTNNTIVGNAGTGSFTQDNSPGILTTPWAATWCWVPIRQLRQL